MTWMWLERSLSSEGDGPTSQRPKLTVCSGVSNSFQVYHQVVSLKLPVTNWNRAVGWSAVGTVIRSVSTVGLQLDEWMMLPECAIKHLTAMQGIMGNWGTKPYSSCCSGQNLAAGLWAMTCPLWKTRLGGWISLQLVVSDVWWQLTHSSVNTFVVSYVQCISEWTSWFYYLSFGRWRALFLWWCNISIISSPSFYQFITFVLYFELHWLVD